MAGNREIINATRIILNDVGKGNLDIDDISESIFSDYLDTAGQVGPDLLIRTSGETRLSNLLLWQMSKTQIWISPVLWPDFKREDLWEAFKNYKPC